MEKKVTKVTKEPLLSTVNPYALAEQVSDTTIEWSSDIKEQQKQIATTLGLAENDVFAADSPILHPYLNLHSGKNLRALKKTDAKKQLEVYLDEKLLKSRANLAKSSTDTKKLSLKKEKIVKLLFDESVSSDNSADWTPDGMSWKDAGVYYNQAPEGDDPIQGALGDCYFIAALASIAWASPFKVLNRASLYHCDSVGDITTNVCHQFDFYSNSGNKYSKKTILEVVDTIPVYNSNNKLRYATSYDDKETWPAIYEKAYAKFISGNPNDKPNYQTIAGGSSAQAMGQIIGGTITKTYLDSSTKAVDILKFIQSNCGPWTLNDYWGKDKVSHRVKYPMTAEVWGADKASEYGLYNYHAYSVFGFDYDNGQYYVVLRNPHGAGPATKDVKKGDWNVISNHYGYGSSIPLGVSDPTHKQRWSGLFAMKLETFVKLFSIISVCK